jgi:hypothetical protein
MITTKEVKHKGIRKLVVSASFCLGIGLDQLTPHYYVITHEKLISDSRPVLPRPITIKEQPFSLSKKNYGRRARHKH